MTKAEVETPCSNCSLLSAEPTTKPATSLYILVFHCDSKHRISTWFVRRLTPRSLPWRQGQNMFIKRKFHNCYYYFIVESRQALFTIINMQLLEKIYAGKVTFSTEQMDRLLATVGKFFNNIGVDV